MQLLNAIMNKDSLQTAVYLSLLLMEEEMVFTGASKTFIHASTYRFSASSSSSPIRLQTATYSGAKLFRVGARQQTPAARWLGCRTGHRNPYPSRRRSFPVVVGGCDMQAASGDHNSRHTGAKCMAVQKRMPFSEAIVCRRNGTQLLRQELYRRHPVRRHQ